MADDRRSALSVGELALADPLLREQQRVRFTIRSTTRRRCEGLVVTLETALGVLRADLSAAALGITALEGGTDLPLDLGLLPAGATTLTLTPIDRAGRSGSGGSLSFETPSGEIAERPQLVDVRPEREVLRRPGRPGDLVTARVRISAWPGSHPIASVHVSVVAPDGSETGVLLPPPSPTGFESFELVAALLDSTAGLGSYELRVTVIDTAGSTSETRSAAVTVTDEDGAPGGPAVDAVEPRAAAAGDIVTISGRGFEARGLSVDVASVMAHVLDIFADGVTFAMPDVDRAGRVLVRTADGTGSSEGDLTPRVTLQIVPPEFAIHEGGEIQLVALVTGTSDHRVTWTADPSRATIDSTGRLTAAFAGTGGRIAVRAAAVADPESSGSATGRVVPMPPREGPVAVGANGGVVLDRTGGLALTVPRSALAEPATIEVERIDWARGGDWSVAAEARIAPFNLELARPARLELPLRVWHDPGSRLAVKHQVDPSDLWEDVERPAIVDPTGFLARLEIVHLGGIRLHKPFPLFDVAASPLPSITSIGPPAIEEGATVAVLVTGTNFVPGFTSVGILDANLAPDPRMEVRGVAVTVDGTRLATTIKAGVMTDLGEGSTRQYRLVVETPAGSDDVPITVLGRDELDVSSGTTTLTVSRTFSRMDIGENATLSITSAHTPLTIDVNERAVIRSRFTSGGSVISRGAAGRAGTHGDIPGTGGSGGAGGSGVGAPGLGRGGGGGTGGGNGNSAGGPGAAGGASPTLTSAGAGGLGGSGGGGGLAPHAGGDGTPGSAGTRGPSGVIPPVVELGPGGGGGGAGGGEGWIFTHRGGGGGGGGAGGGAFRISAGEDVLLFGEVFALGGDGGFGGDAFAGGVSVFAPYRPGRGAGGGGGAGGAVELSGVRQPSGMVVAVGGANRPVAGGALQVNANTPLQTILQQRPSGVIRIDGETPAMTVPGSVGGPDLSYIRELVSTSPQLTVSGFGAEQVRVLDRMGNVRTHGTATQPGGGVSANVSLFDGFNDLWADAVLRGQTALMTNAAIRSRTVIHLSNAVSSYSFSCSIAPAQVTVPTERSVTLSATVTASQPSPIEWGFVTTGIDPGTLIGMPGDSARYTAPCSAPAQPVVVAAASRLAPTFKCTRQVDVIPGVTLASTAAVGVPAHPAVASANVGQTIAITIPQPAFALSQQGFAQGDSATFRVVERTAAGQCQESTMPVQGSIGTGSPPTLEVTVPACAHPDQQVRVAGHGCVRLLVVPTITSVDLDPAIAPNMVIKGTGFVCGGTTIAFDGATLAPGLVISVTCNLIQLAMRPASKNSKVEVSTAGGTSITAVS